jgi:hypothetical protein
VRLFRCFAGSGVGFWFFRACCIRHWGGGVIDTTKNWWNAARGWG